MLLVTICLDLQIASCNSEHFHRQTPSSPCGWRMEKWGPWHYLVDNVIWHSLHNEASNSSSKANGITEITLERPRFKRCTKWFSAAIYKVKQNSIALKHERYDLICENTVVWGGWIMLGKIRGKTTCIRNRNVFLALFNWFKVMKTHNVYIKLKLTKQKVHSQAQ